MTNQIVTNLLYEIRRKVGIARVEGGTKQQLTLSEVVFADNPIQFSPSGRIWDADTAPTETQYEAVYEAYQAADPVTDLDVVYFSAAPQNDRVYAIIGGHYFCYV